MLHPKKIAKREHWANKGGENFNAEQRASFSRFVDGLLVGRTDRRDLVLDMLNNAKRYADAGKITPANYEFIVSELKACLREGGKS